MGSDINSALSDFQDSYATEATCLIAQAIVTMAVIYNLQRHWRLFPIKQLSPLCTLVALLSFFILNVISVVARYIEQQDQLYTFGKGFQCHGEKYLCGQCRINDQPTMQVLSLVYSGLRELPLILFALKTLRVCVCFLDKDTRQLPRPLKWLFSKENRILAVSVVYSLLVGVGIYADMEIGSCSLTDYGAVQTFQFFCPKQSGTVDWVTTLLRYFLLALSYTLSIRTYRQLDFKRFIFIIFLFSNVQVMLRSVFVLMQYQKLLYHQIYYHTLLLNLGGTLILYPYSNFNRYVQQPPSQTIIESFEAFLNYAPGTNILQYFALHRDQLSNSHKYTHCFDHLMAVRQLKMMASLDPKALPRLSGHLSAILEDPYAAEQIPESLQLRDKLRQGLTVGSIKVVQRRLLQFCEKQLFKEWKKTDSRSFVQEQFRRNSVINQKMNTLGIDIGC